jgi:hypothetical protein
MSDFDPATVRKAVAEFTPRRPQKFQDLIPAKEVIAELRQKRASYRAIAELLTQHCLPTSKTAIAAFCHQVLGDTIRPRRRPGRRRLLIPAPPRNGETYSNEVSKPANNLDSADPSASSTGGEAIASRARGPRIAQVRMVKPQSA